MTIFEELSREREADSDRKIKLARQYVAKVIRDHYVMDIELNQLNVVSYARVFDHWKMTITSPVLDGVIFEVTHAAGKYETRVDHYTKTITTTF